jgi:hypothetical protein
VNDATPGTGNSAVVWSSPGPHPFISIISNNLSRYRSHDDHLHAAIGGTDSALLHPHFGTPTSPHVTVVSAFGSIAAEFNLPVGPGEDYLGRFPTTFTDVRIVFDWDITATDVNEGLLGQPMPANINSTAIHQFGFDSNEHMESSAGNVFLLDNVSVAVDAAVPKPATITLLGGGCRHLAGRARRRR